jgi:hypothetical protein
MYLGVQADVQVIHTSANYAPWKKVYTKNSAPTVLCKRTIQRVTKNGE